MAASLKIGFLGAGRMASALAKGFINAGLTSGADILASDPFDGARASFAKEVGATVERDNLAVVKSARVLLVAVKPDQVAALLEEVRGGITEEHLILSIAAGVSLARLESGLPGKTRVIRVMPNTPALVGASATAFALGHAARAEDGELAERLFSAVGVAYRVKEALLDAVTGLSGSGPAYVFLMIEALSDGGVAAGLPRPIATRLAAQTLFGSAKMLLETGQHPAVLKEMVTSPGGTTIEGIHELERAGVRAALMSAVRAATEKSKRLGES